LAGSGTIIKIAEATRTLIFWKNSVYSIPSFITAGTLQLGITSFARLIAFYYMSIKDIGR
jgi:hypothetical protein